MEKDPSAIGLFCRLAIRCGQTDDYASITPVASHLLPYSQRWKKPRYAFNPTPAVFDFSPGDVGLSEGFSQSGWAIHSLASQPEKETPNIVAFSIPDKGIQKRSEQISRGLKSLENLHAAFEIYQIKPDFFVLTFPPWILHEDAFQGLCRTIEVLVDNRYRVDLKKVSFSQYGLPRDGTALILLASSVCSPIQWTEVFDEGVPVGPSVIVRDFIQDLAFHCPDTDHNSLVCKHPFRCGVNIFNHQTGRLALDDSQILNLDSMVPMRKCPYQLRHPCRWLGADSWPERPRLQWPGRFLTYISDLFRVPDIYIYMHICTGQIINSSIADFK